MKRFVKAVVMGLLYLVVLPGGAVSRFTYRALGLVSPFEFFSQALAVVPGLLGRLSRACFYQQCLRQASLDLDIGFMSTVSKIETRIGRRVLVTGHTTIGYAIIGDDAVIANYVSILSGRYQHNLVDVNSPTLAGNDEFVCVRIGEGTFIGEKAIVMADVGAHTVIGAGSVIVKPVPDRVVAVGNPVRVVKQRGDGRR